MANCRACMVLLARISRDLGIGDEKKGKSGGRKGSYQEGLEGRPETRVIRAAGRLMDKTRFRIAFFAISKKKRLDK